jgi:hypothetical protein
MGFLSSGGQRGCAARWRPSRSLRLAKSFTIAETAFFSFPMPQNISEKDFELSTVSERPAELNRAALAPAVPYAMNRL